MTAEVALALTGWGLFMALLLFIIIAGAIEQPLWVSGRENRAVVTECSEWKRVAKQGEQALAATADTLEASSITFQAKLRRSLDTHFNEQELKELCFDIGVEYDNLGATSKAGKITELVNYLTRRGNIGALTAYLRVNRPDVWRATR